MNSTPQTETPQPSTREMPARAKSWFWFLIAGIVLSATAWWMYSRSLDFDLILDDLPTIVDNASIHQLFPLFGDEGDFGPLSPQPGTVVTARPLASLSFAINYHFGGPNPAGYRVVHIILHVATAMLLWAIVSLTLKQPRFAERLGSIRHALGFTAALLWMVHPVHSETLIYVSRRPELMMSFFYLLTLFCSLLYWQSTRWIGRTFWLLAASIACAAGMLCKETMATVVVMILLYEWTFLPGKVGEKAYRSWPLYIALAVGWIPLVWLYTSGAATTLAGSNDGMPTVAGWMTQANEFFAYWKMAFVPWPLLLHHQVAPLASFADAWPGVVGMALYGLLAVVCVCRKNVIGYVMIWFLVVLTPTFFVPFSQPALSEHRLYLPLAAVIPLLVVAVYGWWAWFSEVSPETSPSPPLATAGRFLRDHWVSTAVVVFFTFLGLLVGTSTMGRLSNRQVIWKEVLRYDPDNAHALMCQGSVEFNDAFYDRGLALMQQAFEQQPDSKRIVITFATALEKTGDRKRIVDLYRQAVQANPTEPTLRYNLAFWLEKSGKTGQAIEAYRECLSHAANDQAAHTNLASLLAEQGHLEEAIEHFNAAAKIQPSVVNYMNLMNAYLQNRQDDPAAEAAQRLMVAAKKEGKPDVAARIQRSLADLKARSE